VHLADAPPQQIVPRKKGDEKAGMMESLLKQLLLQQDIMGNHSLAKKSEQSGGDIIVHTRQSI